ncbi:hypothetical protein [Thiorhodococcus mannitoliphagus]|uniref:hypothetical protein n=1 Tax=Thiorhodococcus mannitoliphagus TaxID=329406 RepID=UPI0013DF6532|nr:hypothetical protein [Thiorhodococcus mannitoliphagus]
MPYRDQASTQSSAEQPYFSSHWDREQPALQLQPWAESYQGAQVANRFGKFERQIEADVLSSLNPFCG